MHFYFFFILSPLVDGIFEKGPIIFFYILFIERGIKVESTIENVVILNIKMQKASFQIHFLK